MDILQYLIELLKTRKQIGVEGLGTFYKKKTPGRYDAETHSFLPPSYALEFSSDVLEYTNLSQYIQTKRSISEDSARYFISQFVEEVQKGLQNGEYKLEKLGVLTRIDNELTFTANQDINIGFDFFALPSVTAEIQQTEVVPVETESEIIPPNEESVQEPEIEHVEVPEFEHEMAKLEGEPVAEVPSQTEQETENQEETTVEEIEKHPVKDTEATEENTKVESQEALDSTIPSVEKGETTSEEVYEEIAEVNTENPTGEISEEEDKKSIETWNFEGENVISDDDVYEEETTQESENTTNTETEVNTESNNTEKEDDLKLTSTIQEWDFDNVRNKVSEENTLIGEYDNDQLEEPIEEQRKTMPLYQKVSIGLLILVVILTVVYFIKPELFQNFGKTDVNPNEKMVVPIERSNLQTQKDSLDFADSIMQNAEKVGLDVQPAKDTLKVTTNKSEVKPTITYDIIAAAFARNSEVEEYIAYMKKRGFEAKIAKMPGKLYKKISIASYNNIDSAQKYVVKFRKQFKNPKMYVQPIKNN